MNVTQRFGHGQCIGVVESSAIECLRLGQSQKAQITQFFEHLVRWKYFGSFPLIDVGIDFFVNQTFQSFLNFEVFVGVIHD